MAALDGDRAAVIGLGCIGGSLARALSAAGWHLTGWSTSEADRQAAATAGVDVALGTGAAVRDASVIVLCVPLGALATVAREVCADAPASALVIHAAGLQRIRAVALDPPTHSRVFGTHPLAGSHDHGFGASRADLFAGCTVSAESRLPETELNLAKRLWEAAGAARVEVLDAETHDRRMVWLSHLPQLVATALAAVLSNTGFTVADAGPGARDVTRLAASDPEMWMPLLGAAPHELDSALAGLGSELAVLRTALRTGDADRLREQWGAARAWRRAEPRP